MSATGQNVPNFTGDTSTRNLTFVFAAVAVLIHVIFNRGYGYFRDELYYLACGQHLAFGYVDQAPLIAVVARVSRSLFGDSLSSIRLFPALAAGGKLLLTGVLVRQFGGKRWAMFLACVAVLFAPVYLATDNVLTMNGFEPLFWMGCAYLIARIASGGSPRLWLWFGVVAGLGLENKHSMAFFGAAILAGTVLTPLRRHLMQKWIWLGAVIALLIAMPNVVWEARNHWATWELLKTVAHSGKNVVLSPAAFLGQQAIIVNPLSLPVWLAGLAWLLFSPQGKTWRALGIAYLALLTEMMVLHGKHYYMAPAYPMLFAAGGVALLQWLGSRRAWIAPAYAALIALTGALIAPTVMPILPPEKLPAYMQAIHFEPPKTETSHTSPLPQILADQFGWPEMVGQVAAVYDTLSPEDRAQAAIFAQDYGQAAAVDFFGPRYGLPHAISGHQSYFLWGPGNYNGDVLILFDTPSDSVCHEFASVRDYGQLRLSQWAMPWERASHLYVCRGLKMPVSELWPKVKFWY